MELSAAASRWSIIGRAVGLGATWGAMTGVGLGFLVLPDMAYTVPLGVVLGTAAGLLSGLAAGLLMVLAEAARAGGAAAQSRLLGGLGTPVTVLVLFSIWPEDVTYSGVTVSLTVAMTAWGAIVGAGFGPFIATGLDDYRRHPDTPESDRVPAGVSWLRIVLPVLVAAGMAVVCWNFSQNVD